MLIERYIYLEWLKVFLLTLGLMLGMLVLQIVYDDLENLVSYGASFGQILVYFGIQIPAFLPTVLPITFLLSILIALGSLHRSSEVIAMRASGLGLLTLSRGFFLIGLCLSLLLLYLSGSVVPQSVEQSRNMLNNLRFGAIAGQADSIQDTTIWAPQLAYHHSSENRTWFINHLNRRSFIGRGITIHFENDEGVELRRLEAREGFFDDRAGTWTFLRGREVFFDETGGEPTRFSRFSQKTIEDWDERPEFMLALRQRPKDLSLFELTSILNQLPPDENPASIPFLVRYQVNLATPFVCFFLVGIGVPFAIRGVRTNAWVGASQSIGIFFAYFLVSSLSVVMGERGILPALLAAWLPIGLLALAGCYTFYKAR